MNTVLEEILASTREEVERRKRELPVAELGEAAPGQGETHSGGASRARRSGEALLVDAAPSRRFRDALTGPGIAVIAEFKRRSPSAGRLREEPDVGEVVGAYERGGAAALSILTEGPHFEGSLQDLSQARAATALPVLRKDFIVDPYQLHEAAVAGADAVLLIVAALDEPELASLYEAAVGLGLDALVEVHDGAELETALSVGADLIGINNRDLRDFSVDVERTSKLLGAVPAGVAVVSESGIVSAEQLERLQGEGVCAVLVGETLMRAADPEEALRRMRDFSEYDARL